MTRNAKVLATFVVAMLVAFVGRAAAESIESHYASLSGAAPTIIKAAISSTTTDTDVWTTPVAPQRTYGNPNVTACVRGTSSGATTVLALGLYQKVGATYTFLGIVSKQTVTLTTGDTDTAKYVGTTVPTWDTRGAQYYDLRILTASAGSMDVRVWSYGSQSTAAD